MHEDETLRHLIAKALYEEDAWPDRDWHELHDDKRIGWLEDADRVIRVVNDFICDGVDPYKLGKEWCHDCKHDDGAHAETCRYYAA